jgi:signal transduction histidine kinase
MEAIGRLAAGLAHDFNNALHVVLGNLGRVEARLPDEADVRTALGRAKRAGEHVAALTRQLLAFARRSGLDPRPVALNTVLAGSGEALSRVLGEGVELRYDLDPGLPPCVVDPARVEAALLDLLANARDAMPGGGRATVRTGTAWLDEAAVVAGGDGLRPGRYVVLAVEDEGPGMPPEVLARAAEPFFTTKAGKGTGLGLATVHGFVRQSGGRLEISSAPGRGTTVRMLFPAASGEAEAPAAFQGRGVLDTEGGTETVLVVDDDRGVLDLAVHHLTALGYRVLSARSGEAALEVLERTEGRVDLLFTDLSMPGA